MDIKEKSKAGEDHFKVFVQFLGDNADFRAYFNGKKPKGYTKRMYINHWKSLYKGLSDVDKTLVKTDGQWEEVS